MNNKAQQLSDENLDILKEVGNIGAGNAATALSEMINKTINMHVPKVKFLGFNEVTELLGGADNLVAGILIQIEGDLNGYMMFLLEFRYAKRLVDTLMGFDGSYEEEAPFEEMEISALMEITNILTGSYLNSIASLTGLEIVQSVPLIAIDMAGAILSVPAVEFGKVGDSVLFVESEFYEGGYSIKGNFFLIPDFDSFQVLMKVLKGE